MAAPRLSTCPACEILEAKLSEAEDDHEVLEAQRDHYRNRCDELILALSETQRQLASKLKMSEYAVDPSLFGGESLERLMEWQVCLACCVEEKLEGEVEKGEATKEGEKEGKGKSGKGLETILPFSPGNLAGFLTRNHQLTQKHTKYPEVQTKKSDLSKEGVVPHGAESV
jgi:hypothetical protein